MPYFVKWTLAGQDEVFDQPVSYANLSDALDSACTVLYRHPTDIWIEDDTGSPFALDFRIKQHCTSKGHA